MNLNKKHPLIEALHDFFENNQSWPQNDEWALYQPDYDHMILKFLIYTIRGIDASSKSEEVNTNALNFISQTIVSLDDKFDTNFRNIPLDDLELPEFVDIPANIKEICTKIDYAIRFLMEEDRQLIDIEDGDHGHDWPIGNLICEECSESPSYIGLEVYDLCELASAASLKIINLSEGCFDDLLNAEPIVMAAFSANRERL
jgi:hypothetical protein